MDPIIFQNAFEGKQWDELTKEDKEQVLLNSNSLGRCVFDGPQDLVDHQVTSVVFENGVTVTLNMIGGTSYPCRTLHIITTSGEIYGVMEEGHCSRLHFSFPSCLILNFKTKKIRLHPWEF